MGKCCGEVLWRSVVFSLCVFCLRVFSLCVFSLCVSSLCVFSLCVFCLCVSLCVFCLCFLPVCSLCVFSLCFLSVCFLSVCFLSVFSSLCFLSVFSVCVFRPRFLSVFSVCVFSLCCFLSVRSLVVQCGKEVLWGSVVEKRCVFSLCFLSVCFPSVCFLSERGVAAAPFNVTGFPRVRGKQVPFGGWERLSRAIETEVKPRMEQEDSGQACTFGKNGKALRGSHGHRQCLWCSPKRLLEACDRRASRGGLVRSFKNMSEEQQGRAMALARASKVPGLVCGVGSQASQVSRPQR